MPGCCLTRIELPDDPRAVALFAELGRRFYAFAGRLPLPLCELASRTSTYLGSPEGEPFEGIAGLNPVLAGAPWLFWETFQGLDDDTFSAIAEAGAYFVLASIILDHLVDGQAECPETMALFHQALYEAGVAGYRTVLPSPSRFWGHFDRLATNHLEGIAAELNCLANPAQLDAEAFQSMAHGKVSPVIATVAALAEASGQPDALDPIETSLKHIAVASQLLDDIGDWRDDVQSGHLTFFLSEVAGVCGWDSGQWLSVDNLEARINGGWEDVKHMRIVSHWLDESLGAVEGLRCAGWVNYVKGYQAQADDHMIGFIARHILRAIGPLAEAQNRRRPTP